MKKINTIFVIIGIICFGIAGYIIYDEFIVDNDIKVNFNEDEEMELLNSKLIEIGSPLGWIIIVDGISNQEDGNYNISFEENLLLEYGYKQLFVMEYILSNNVNYELFTVVDMDGNKIEDEPTSDFTKAYINYDKYNEYYKSFFGEDFDTDKATKGKTKYDKEYVYYDNRRAGSNGVYVSMMQANEVEYNDGVYTASGVVTYSTRASELVGGKDDNFIIEYTKDINDNIILKSFVLNSRNMG